MRTEQEILTDLQAAGAEYHTKAKGKTITHEEMEQLPARIKGFQKELQGYFMQDVTLHEGITGISAMRKSQGTPDFKIAPIVEVGGDTLVPKVGPDGQELRDENDQPIMEVKHVRARGLTREDAVKNWNDKKFIK